MSTARTTIPLLSLLVTLAGSPVMAAGAQVFSTPEQATQALVEAAATDEVGPVLGVLGTDARPLLDSGDAVADDAALQRFVDKYNQAHALVAPDDATRKLILGDDDWPFPIPLVKTSAGWVFDTRAGQTEILARRVGRNELDTIQVCLNYVQAQREYREMNPEGDAVPHYASKLISAAGKHDGLYWPVEPGKPESPFGPAVGGARVEGYDVQAGKRIPYHGYFYRILTAQGSHADGGAISYLVKGKLTGGFALVAYPATYGNSGIMTFLVNQAGVVFQKNLGPNTAALAAAMKSFDPDKSWKPTGLPPDEGPAPVRP